jgi:hypothetical protein
MKRLKFIALVLVTGTILSCQKTKTTPTPVASKTNITPIEIGRSCLYGGGSEGITQQNLVITDSIAWNNLKAQMNSVNNATYNFTEQTIDFSQWTVLASFDQVRTSGGFEIDFSSIVQNSTNIEATVYPSSPNGGAVTTVITQPYIIVKIPKSTLPIIFI